MADNSYDYCCPDSETGFGRVELKWGAPGIGFGMMAFYYNDAGDLCCDNEAMSKEFIKERLCKMVDDSIFDG